MTIYNRWGDPVRITGVNTGDEVSSDRPNAKFDLNVEFEDGSTEGNLATIDLRADGGFTEMLVETVKVYTKQQVKRTDERVDFSYKAVLKDLGLNPAPDLEEAYKATVLQHSC